MAALVRVLCADTFAVWCVSLPVVLRYVPDGNAKGRVSACEMPHIEG